MSIESEEASTKKESTKDITATRQFDILVRFGNSSGKIQRIQFDSGRTLQKRLAAFPEQTQHRMGGLHMAKKTRVILIIYFYDKERDIVSAIVKFLLI